MKQASRIIAAVLSGLIVMAAAQPTILAQMRWHQRVLLLFAADARTPALSRQQAAMAAWAGQAADRDLVTVTVIGDRVSGAADMAATLRRRFRPAPGFTAILIGKDGGEKLRSAEPIEVKTLEETIDAMPMRRGGER